MPTRGKLDLKDADQNRMMSNTTIISIPNGQKVSSMSKTDLSDKRQAAKQSIMWTTRSGIQTTNAHEDGCSQGQCDQQSYSHTSIIINTDMCCTRKSPFVKFLLKIVSRTRKGKETEMEKRLWAQHSEVKAGAEDLKEVLKAI